MSWEESLWPGLRAGASNEIAAYLTKSGIEKHTGCNNLKSSWVACANLYFPFRGAAEDRALLAAFLRCFVSDTIITVEDIELEYAEEEALAPSTLLGEAGGRRGSGQTSPDVAILVNDRTGIILAESKLTEHSFYSCSARGRQSFRHGLIRPGSLGCGSTRLVSGDHWLAWIEARYGLGDCGAPTSLNEPLLPAPPSA